MFPNKGINTTWRKYVADLNDRKLTVTENPKAVLYKHPGLSIAHYDREGNPDIIAVMKFLIEVRNCGLYIPYNGEDQYFLDWPTLKMNSLNFVTSTIITFSSAIYESTLAKWPLDARLSLGYVGNSSYALSLSMYIPGSSDPVAVHSSQYVVVDKVTRRSKKLPDWFTAKYKGMGVFNEGLRVKTLSKPEETYTFQIQVLWSHTDKNNHTNFSSYVLFAVNALRAALYRKEKAQSEPGESSGEEEDISTRQAQRCLRNITQDIMKNGLKSIKICFSKESNQGDELDIHLWQEDNDTIVLCLVELEAQALCHIQLEYFNTLSHL